MDRNELEHVRSLAGGKGPSDWVMPAALLAVGLPFVLSALWMVGSTLLFRATAVPVQGVVVERKGDVTSLVVEYADRGGAKHRLETFGSDLYDDVEEGQKVGVYMNPNKPKDAQLAFFTDSWMLPLILGIFGSFFAIPGLIFLRANLRPMWQSKQLAQRGIRIQADVVDVEPVMTLESFKRRMRSQGSMSCTIQHTNGKWEMNINGQAGDPFDPAANRDWGIQYRVVARWQDTRTGQTHECLSEPVDIVPWACLQFRKVDVLVDPDDPKNCRVDFDGPTPDSVYQGAGPG